MTKNRIARGPVPGRARLNHATRRPFRNLFGRGARGGRTRRGRQGGRVRRDTHNGRSRSVLVDRGRDNRRHWPLRRRVAAGPRRGPRLDDGRLRRPLIWRPLIWRPAIWRLDIRGRDIRGPVVRDPVVRGPVVRGRGRAVGEFRRCHRRPRPLPVVEWRGHRRRQREICGCCAQRGAGLNWPSLMSCSSRLNWTSLNARGNTHDRRPGFALVDRGGDQRGHARRFGSRGHGGGDIPLGHWRGRGSIFRVVQIGRRRKRWRIIRGIKAQHVLGHILPPHLRGFIHDTSPRRQ